MKIYLKYSTILYFIFSLSSVYINAQDIQTHKHKPSHVEIKSVDGKFNFYVNGELFKLKGAGGSSHLAELHHAGGNSIRTWGASQNVLDSAQKYNIMVAMGLSMEQELHGFNYDDADAVENQYKRNIKAIEQFKNHPNLLCWVVGNELNLSPPGKGSPVNPKVYDAVKNIIDYIHTYDPHHPATTALAGVIEPHVKVALERIPNLDFISLQVYGELAEMSELVKQAKIAIPFAITEYGPVGHWQMPKTEWGREIEETSAQKASGLFKRIQEGIVNDPTGLCLGGYAFLWGQKQERTPTWYSLFLNTGELTANIDELTRYWTGYYPENLTPIVDELTINNKTASDNVYLKAGTRYTAKVKVSDPNGDKLTYRWEIMKEVVHRSQGGAREIVPDVVNVKVFSEKEGIFVFTAPKEKGEYRLYSYVFDGKNKVGTANIPFMVN